MPTELQFRRDTELNLNGITGLDGEIFVNTDDYSLRVHDGATQGGASTIPTKNYVDIKLNTKLDALSYNANDVLNKLLTVDGPGSNLNADLLDGQEGSYYLNYSNFTSTPTIGNATITITAGNGLSTGGNFATNQTSNETITLNHADTSTQSSLNSNTQGTVIQNITLDTYGHITGMSTVDLSTDDVDEGSNLYFTTGRIDSHLSGGTGVTYSSGTISIGQDVGTTSNVSFNTVTASSFSGDGSSVSNVDADLLDGQNGTHYLNYNNFTNTPTIGSGTLTVSGGSGLSGSGTFDANATSNNTITLNHADTSSQSSSSNTGRTYIQSLTLDTYGHVTGLSTGTETVVNTNDIDYVSGVSLNGTSLDFSGVGNAFSGSVDLSSFLDDTDTTYSISAETASGGANLRLTGSDSSTDDVNLAEGSNVSISRTDASTITIGSSHPSISAASSMDNSGVVVVQDVTLDSNGHVTGLGAQDLNDLSTVVYGDGNTASGSSSTAVGNNNISSTTFTSTFGYGNEASEFNSTAIGRSNAASGQTSTAIGVENVASGNASTAVGYYVRVATDNVHEFGKWDTSSNREGAIRLHDTGMAAITLENNATAYSAATIQDGSEANGEIANGMFAFRRDGTDVYMDINAGGTIETKTIVGETDDVTFNSVTTSGGEVDVASDQTFDVNGNEINFDYDRIYYEGNLKMDGQMELDGHDMNKVAEFVTNEFLDNPFRQSSTSWDSNADTFVTVKADFAKPWTKLRRCVLYNDNTFNYYLHPNNSNLKIDGTPANLDGSDGQVMVEIPKFYYKYKRVNDVIEYDLSEYPGNNRELYPAFIVEGGKVADYVYVGAYDGVWYSSSAEGYTSPENSSALSFDSSNDWIGSVSGEFPIVGVTRPSCRTLCQNLADIHGGNWHQVSFWTVSAIQLLFFAEYGSFSAQEILGEGNTRHSSWPSTTGDSNTRAVKSGYSNSLGNASGGESDGTINVADNGDFASYRGIENLFGNVWTWVDGVSVNVGGNTDGEWWVTNNKENFADNTSTGHTLLTTSMPSDGYVVDVADVSGAFIPSDTSGGSSTTFLTDYFFDDNNNGNRVLLFGGDADNGSLAGPFYWAADSSSSYRYRGIGARIATYIKKK